MISKCNISYTIKERMKIRVAGIECEERDGAILLSFFKFAKENTFTTDKRKQKKATNGFQLEFFSLCFHSLNFI